MHVDGWVGMMIGVGRETTRFRRRAMVEGGLLGLMLSLLLHEEVVAFRNFKAISNNPSDGRSTISFMNL